MLRTCFLLLLILLPVSASDIIQVAEAVEKQAAAEWRRPSVARAQERGMPGRSACALAIEPDRFLTNALPPTGRSGQDAARAGRVFYDHGDSTLGREVDYDPAAGPKASVPLCSNDISPLSRTGG